MRLRPLGGDMRVVTRGLGRSPACIQSYWAWRAWCRAADCLKALRRSRAVASCCATAAKSAPGGASSTACRARVRACSSASLMLR